MTLLPSAVAALVPLVVAAALLLAALALVVTRQVAVALPVLLDLLLVAGLLRLEATASWQAIGSAAAIVLIRKLATLGITAAARARSLHPGGDRGKVGQCGAASPGERRPTFP